MNRGTGWLLGVVCSLLAGGCAAQVESQPEMVVLMPEGAGLGALSGGFYVDFVKDIKPILETRCLSCHHSGSGKSGLSFESRRKVMAANRKYQLIVPGEPERSGLFLVTVVPEHYTESMPHDGNGHRLDKGDTWLLYQWIAAGADWPEDGSGALKPRSPDNTGELPPAKEAMPEKKDVPPPPGITSSPRRLQREISRAGGQRARPAAIVHDLGMVLAPLPALRGNTFVTRGKMPGLDGACIVSHAIANNQRNERS